MTIKEINIRELKPYEFNPRNNEHAVETVAASIKEFGFKVPIVVDADNVIIAGHTRLKAAEMLGIETVPCIVADDLTPEQIRAFRLADNKTSEFANWNIELLEHELSELEEMSFDMQQFGFVFDSIDWAGVDDLSDTTYEKPEKTLLECPHCHHRDSANHFKKVEATGEEIEEISDEDILE